MEASHPRRRPAEFPAALAGILARAAVFLLLWITPASAFDQIPVPRILEERGIRDQTDPVAVADTFLNIPYRLDGTLDEQGRFTLFEEPDRIFDDPGLNCSGLLLSATRFLLRRNITLQEAQFDRLGDSGLESPLGKNWDYGWDLILNLTEGRWRQVVMPDDGDYHLEGQTAETLRGFDLQDQAAWEKVLARIKPGYLYLASLSKPTAKAAALHWHVSLILADAKGGVYLYQTTRTSNRTYRTDLRSASGRDRFHQAFPHSWRGKKMILIIETKLPIIQAETGE
ncbi:MAG: hypothetical protein AB1896_02015 [Thermodesulfobacteriota bacterium]